VAVGGRVRPRTMNAAALPRLASHQRREQVRAGSVRGWRSARRRRPRRNEVVRSGKSARLV